MDKKQLETLIEQVVSNVMAQQAPVASPAPRRTRARRPNPNNMDVNTPEGRNNVVMKLKSTFSAIATRANILDKKSGNALRTETKEDFIEVVSEMMDNLVTLMSKDFDNFAKTYTEVANLLGLPQVVIEANTVLDTPDGRRNVIRAAVNSIGKLKKMSDEANKMLLNAEATNNISIFKNEIKAMGPKIKEMKAEAVVLDKIFSQTFPARYQQFKSQQLVRTSNPPPVPTR